MTEGARKNSLKKNKDRWIIYYIRYAGNYIEEFHKAVRGSRRLQLAKKLKQIEKKIRQSQNSKKNIMYQKKVTILHYLAQMFNIYVVIMTETINTFLAKAFLEV